MADHDFTKFGLVPSCILAIDLPEEISDLSSHCFLERDCF